MHKNHTYSHIKNRSGFAYYSYLTVMLITALLCIVYAYLNHCWFHKAILGNTLILAAAGSIIAIIHLIKTGKQHLSSRILLAGLALLFTVGFMIGATTKLGLMWISLLPLIAFYTQGIKRGLIYSIIFGC